MTAKVAKRLTLLAVAGLLIYFLLIGYRAFYLIGQRPWDLKLLGVVVLAFPFIGVWVLIVELRFGFTTQELADELNAEDTPAEPDLPRLPSGRIDRAAADAHFATRRAEVEANPDDWRGWYHLAVAYDLAGDRRRAREAMRTAASRRASADSQT